MLSEGTTDFLDKELTQLENEFRRRIGLYLNAKLGQADLLSLMAELDFFNELQGAGLSNVINKIESEYVGVIESIVKDAKKLNVSVSGLSLESLETIMNLDADNILNSAKSYSNQFKSAIIKGALSGQTTNEIVSSLDNVTLRTNQLIAAVNTAKDEFQASGMAKIFEDDPSVKFVLAGPVDGRTRCQCRAVMLKQPETGLTKKEIDAGAWTKIALANCPKFEGEYTFIKRGSFNCRHYIQIAG